MWLLNDDFLAGSTALPATIDLLYLETLLDELGLKNYLRLAKSKNGPHVESYAVYLEDEDYHIRGG